MDHFADRLTIAAESKGNAVVVGLDPRLEQLPATLRDTVDPRNRAEVASVYSRFCREIVDVVGELVPAVKPQAAFFEQWGPAGMQALQEVINYARQQRLVVILDAKRNDIGSTASAYASAYLGEQSAWRADALTISPYLGGDSLTPFVETARERGCGVFVLVKTSNPGGGMFQDAQTPEGRIYERVGRYVESLARESLGQCGYGSVGAVVGATYPGQLAELRAAMPHTWFLVPGFGAQGGTADDVASAFDERGRGAIVNSSRAIIFAHERPEYRATFGSARWHDAVAAATRDMISQLRLSGMN